MKCHSRFAWRSLCAALVLLMVFLFAPSVEAELIVIAPGNVSSSSEIGSGFNRQDDFLVDGSGLTGVEHTDAVEPNMWLSRGDAFGGEDTDPWVQFDLGAVYRIDSIRIWNYNENPPNLTGRGVDALTVEYGDTLALGSTVPGITNLAQASGAPSYTGEVFNAFAPFTARYIKFDIDSNHGGDNNFYGLSEVQFDGVAIPEPSAIALIAFGGASVLVLRRRCPRF